MTKAHRLGWLDWQRGLAVLFMIEVHVVNAWTSAEAASGALHVTLKLIGGFAAPGFLFMAGLAQALADASLAHKGVSPAARWRQHAMRGLWVLGVAYGFRLAEYLLGFAFLVPGGWRGLFRVDVLNVIGVSLVLTAAVALGRSWRARFLLASGAAVAVVLLTPLAARVDPVWHGGWLYTHPGTGFGLLNWTAFALAGSATGALVGRGTRGARILVLGLATAAAGWMGWFLPSIHAPAELWGTSPAWFLVRLGATVALSGALMLLPSALRGVGWLTLLGRHSLATYMVSVELTYGLLLQRLHGRLSQPAVLTGVVLMTAAMVALAKALDARAARRKGAPVPATAVAA